MYTVNSESIKNLLTAVLKATASTSEPKAPAKEIVMAEGRWDFIGMVQEDGLGNLTITDCYNLRRWGTTAGLGQIALEGPTDNSVLDFYGTVKVPAHAVNGRITCKV